VGGHGCNAEDTFAPSKPNTSDADGKTVASSASRLLQSFDSNDENISISRTPATGKGAARRNQANDVDLNHPWIGIWSSGDPEKREMLMEFGSSGLDVLQSYIDSLVELGRMDDSKLGLHFFEEWKANVLAKETSSLQPVDH
jgi:hypothetical protein